MPALLLSDYLAPLLPERDHVCVREVACAATNDVANIVPCTYVFRLHSFSYDTLSSAYAPVANDRHVLTTLGSLF
jgi:hypothetical protein